MERERLRHYRCSASVIAQQYSSATFVQLRCHSRKDKQGTRLKNLITSIYLFF